MPFPRLIEARSLITHGLGEAGAQHEAYMEEFRQMVAQVERLYPIWLIDRRPLPENPTDLESGVDPMSKHKEAAAHNPEKTAQTAPATEAANSPKETPQAGSTPAAANAPQPSEEESQPKRRPERGPIERTLSRMIQEWVKTERQRGYLTAEIEGDATEAIEFLNEQAAPRKQEDHAHS